MTKVKTRKVSGGVNRIKGKVGAKMKARAKAEDNGRIRVKAKKIDVPAMCLDLQKLQRQRAWHLKSRNMVSNRLQATVAGTLGYHSGMKEPERKKAFDKARLLIKQVANHEATCGMDDLIRVTVEAINGFERMKKSLEETMLVLSTQLPVVDWVGHIDQRGFGLPLLGVIIGETGDLSNYPNPGKLWRRLGCAPYTKEDVTLMGATWRSRSGGKKGVKLSSADWEDFGYSPRRRSIAYLIGEGIVKLNQTGPYRKRYDEAKTLCQEKHPDYSKGRCHNHGKLLATKLLLKTLWIEWWRHNELAILKM